MKKIKLFIVLTIILSITLIISGCNNKSFGFKTQEEIINSFTNYSIEFTVTQKEKTTKYSIIEDESYILYQVGEGLSTLYKKSTKMKYIIKYHAKTKAMYISTEDIDKIVGSIKKSFFAAHVNIANDYKKKADETINGILCDVYTRESEGLSQNCYVSKADGFCVKTYVENNGEITSYEVLSFVKGNQSCEEYYEYPSVEYSLWPDHPLAVVIPELTAGDYKSHIHNSEYLEIVYNNVTLESYKSYISILQNAKYNEDIEEKEEAGFNYYIAHNNTYQVIIQYYNSEITIKISKLS